MPLKRIIKPAHHDENIAQQPIRLKYSRLFLPIIILGGLVVLMSFFNYLSITHLVHNTGLMLWFNFLFLVLEIE